jgi:hypothetical protein
MENYRPGDRVAVLVSEIVEHDDEYETHEVISTSYQLFEVPHSEAKKCSVGELVILECLTTTDGFRAANPGDNLWVDRQLCSPLYGTWKIVTDEAT